jgi:hypothetical protein
LSGDARLFAYGETDFVAVFEVETGKQLIRAPVESGGPCVFAFSPDGRLLAWGARFDPHLSVLEIATGQERCRFPGHVGRTRCMRFSADGKLLVSGGEDTTALVWDLFGLRDGKKKREPLSPAQLRACWTDMGSADAARAHRALGRLIGDSEHALAFLETQFTVAPVLDEKKVASLIGDLDSGKFAVREAAARELDKLAEAAVPAYRKAPAEQPSVEQRRRLEGLLAKHAESPQRRAVRAIEALELAGTPAAKQLIVRLTKGEPELRLTQEAKRASRLNGPEK